jgi:Ran GTPase-activating protein (RanGAP) involved in mRNA processing and transport
MKRTSSFKPNKNEFTEIIQDLSRTNTEIISIKDVTFKESENFDLLGISLVLCITLQVIDIHECHFSVDVFESFMLYIVKCPSLGWIFLKNNNLNDKHVKCIVNKFDKFESLMCLNLSGNLITKSGANNLCDNIFKCPTLQKVMVSEEYDKRISISLERNYIQIAKFHEMVLESRISEYEFKLDFFPTLINSYINGMTLLHYLVSDEIYAQLLPNILKFRPNPYLTDISKDKTPLHIASSENREIIQEYMNLYNS